MLISASEYQPDTVPRFTPVINRFIGLADIVVKAIAPSEGAVQFVIDVHWDQPLDVVTDIVVLDPPALMVDSGTGEAFQLGSGLNSKTAQEFGTKHLSDAQVKELQRLVRKSGPKGPIKTTKTKGERKKLSKPKR